jgi:DNA-binding IclR family transcriptional regulator
MVDLYPVDEEIIELIQEEYQTVPARLSEQTGYDRQYIQKRLKRLSELGYVDKLGHGLYRFTSDPREEID